MSLAGVADAKLSAVEDKLYDTADRLGIISCEDMGEVSYDEFMRVLKDIHEDCYADDKKCFGDLVTLKGMCEGDGCNTKTHMNCLSKKYIVQTKDEYCKLDECGNEENEKKTGYCTEKS